MASEEVIDRLQECRIDETVIAIVQDGSRFEGQVSDVEHADQSDGDPKMLSVRVVVTEGTIQRHDLIRDSVELRADRPDDGS